MQKKLFCLMLILLLAGAIAHSEGESPRETLRESYRKIVDARATESPYAVLPDPASRDSAGRLTEEAQRLALDEVNFIRSIAGLAPVELDPLCGLRAQNAAYLLSVNDAITHDPASPDGMPAGLYESGHLGAQCSNIAMLNRGESDALIDGVVYFARDDGDRNLETLSHRRWLLNPAMGRTGFGLSEALSGAGYVAMYAVDDSAEADWTVIPWPAAGAFPVEYMRVDLPWSISLNETLYDLNASRLQIRMEELNSGAAFSFEPSADTEDGYCGISAEHCGSGACLIFRPNIAARGLAEYVQNQRWRVSVEGLILTDGKEAALEYETDMVSLYPQDPVNVEISSLELRMKTGESARLSVEVIPEYADDRSVSWCSDEPSIAIVDENGVVTAVSAGVCRVRALSVNGRFDECEITVY